MKDFFQSWFDAENRGNIATISVVCITFFVTYLGLLQDEVPPSLTARLVALLCGAFYLYFLIWDKSLLNRFGTAAYFIVQTALVVIIQFLLVQGPTIWLITMPLAGHVVALLSGWWRWLMYAVLLGIMAVSTGLQSGSLFTAFLFTLYFSPALIFVVIFVEITKQSEEARLKAEQLTTKLEAANQQLSVYATQAEELATTKERNRIAREIHDNLGHYLTVVNVQIKAAQAIMSQNPDKAQDALQKAQRLTEEGLTAVRQSISALRESPVDQQPLPEALAALVYENQSSGIVTELGIQGEPRQLDAKANLTIYRAVQEGLTNIRKHARASRVDLLLDYRNPETVQLLVIDNGVGTAVPSGGFGLLGLRERVQLLGGQINTKTAPGEGFQLAISLPG